MFQDDGSSSSVTSSSPLKFLPMMSLPHPTTLTGIPTPHPWLKDLKPEERGLYLIHLLLTCANQVSTNNLENANVALDHLSHLVSPDGDSMQRVAAYFTEALAGRILKSAFPGLHKAMNAANPKNSVSEDVLVRKLFSEMFPFTKSSYLLTNQAIIESMEGEKMVHLIDLNACDSTQWIALMQAFNSRPDGPPHLRITGIHHQKDVLEQTARRLTEEAEKLDIPFQFNPVVCKIEDLNLDQLRVKTGEALAISLNLQLHLFLASDDDFWFRNSQLGFQRPSPSQDSNSSSPRSPTKLDRFLNAIWGLSPKLMVVTEQDSNHNGSTLMDRLLEALYTYAALFDCLESKVPRSSQERTKLEKFHFGKEIKNIIACEGSERKERHEKLEKWIQRLEFAGFANVPVSYYGMLQAKRLIQGYGCDGYRIKEENGCAVLCWQDRPLYSVSAWRCRK